MIINRSNVSLFLSASFPGDFEMSRIKKKGNKTAETFQQWLQNIHLQGAYYCHLLSVSHTRAN